MKCNLNQHICIDRSRLNITSRQWRENFEPKNKVKGTGTQNYKIEKLLNGRNHHRDDKRCIESFNHDITHRVPTTPSSIFFSPFISLHPFFRFQLLFPAFTTYTASVSPFKSFTDIQESSIQSPVKANKMVHQTYSILCRNYTSHYCYYRTVSKLSLLTYQFPELCHKSIIYK